MSGYNTALGKSSYLRAFGDSPINRVLDFLVVFDQYDYSMMDIAEHSGVSYSTLKYLLPQLEKKNIIVKTRVSGKSSLYKINKNNNIVTSFIRFYWDVSSVRKTVKN